MSSIERTEVRTAALDGWFVDRIAETALGTAAGPAGALVEREAPRRGLMPPLHARSQDETYHVLAGELIFFVGDEVVPARAGDVVIAPRGVPRTYRVESDGARWLVLTRLTSVARFEDFGRALAEPLDDVESGWPSADEEAALAGIACVNGIDLLGPPGMLPSDL
jgi:mannose-6-phosphate isomerase-like protein (cupin superfamily)